MLKLNHTFIRGGAMVAFASLFVNAAMADISVERLNTYKTNRLIPASVKLDAATTPQSEVVSFSEDTLSWSKTSQVAKLKAQFGDMSLDDIIAQYGSADDAWLRWGMMGDYDDEEGGCITYDGCPEEINELRAYLNQIALGNITGKISQQDAQKYLQDSFNALARGIANSWGDYGKFPMDTIDISGIPESAANFHDFSKCTGLSPEKVLSALKNNSDSFVYKLSLPELDFSALGDDIFADFILPWGTEFARGSKITVEQFRNAKTTSDYGESCTTTYLDFDIDFTKAGTDILKGTDVSNAYLYRTSLSGAQIANSAGWGNAEISATQYAECEAILASTLTKGKTQVIKVLRPADDTHKTSWIERITITGTKTE